jgi:ribonucleotide reductase beta subunit family protein with ferritin-like domain
MEEILRQNPNRYTTFPIKYHDLWELYKKAIASFWTVEEIDFTQDMNDWENKLSDGDRHFIKMILAFFAASDGIVFENLSLNFVDEVQIPEARSFYAYQGFNESIHGETYSQLIEKYIRDPTEKTRLFSALEHFECIRRKASWALRYMDRSRTFARRLLAFACVEGIFFSGSFCAIFWLKNRGVMPGLGFSNELISRDEGLHLEFAVALFGHLNSKPPRSEVVEIVTDAVAIEKEFIQEAIPVKLIGMDSEKMGQYIEYVADRLMKQLGYAPIWNTINPFDWMENISLEGKTNFFEKRVGEYSKHIDSSTVMKFDDDF